MHSVRRTRTIAMAGLLAALSLPTSAEAASGLYLQLGLGYGTFTGSKPVTVEDSSRPGDFPLDFGAPGCCPEAGLATQLRLGFSILGFAGPEIGVVGDGWNNFDGGAGFVGGGVRIFPLKFLSLTGLDTNDLPIDMGVGVMFGYTILGEDFLMEGTFWDVDFSVEYELTSFLSAGVKLDILMPSYNNFAFTSFKNDQGRCLDGVNQVLNTPGGNENGVIDQSQADAACANFSGPSATLLSPQLVFTFHFDILDV